MRSFGKLLVLSVMLVTLSIWLLPAPFGDGRPMFGYPWHFAWLPSVFVDFDKDQDLTFKWLLQLPVRPWAVRILWSYFVLSVLSVAVVLRVCSIALRAFLDKQKQDHTG